MKIFNRKGSPVASLSGSARENRTPSFGYEPNVLPLDDQRNGDTAGD